MNKHQLLIKAFYLALFFFFSFYSFAQVTQQWVARYDGPGVTRDGITDMTTDKWGNVYVTGNSATGDFTSSYTTIKYNADGAKVWGKTYHYANNTYDAPRAIVVDNVGNVYVTGRSTLYENEADYQTIKYDTNGNLLWVKRYGSPIIGFSVDIAWDIAVDASGNVYVTGFSENEQSGDDCATLKYDASGNLLWEKRFANSFGTALTLDDDGNVYVTGKATIKYNNNGSELWSTSYSDFRAYSIAIDDLGNVYINGEGQTIKYNSTGSTLWAKVSPGLSDSKLALDENNNVYITGNVQGNTTGRNIRTVKYSTSGNWLWSKAYNSKYNLDDVGSEIEVAPDGNIYVTGKSITSELSAEYVTLKYSSSGNQLFIKTTSADNNLFAYLPQLAVDASSNAYVGGSTPEKLGDKDFVTVKYAADGNWLWTKKFNYKSRATDVAKAITTDANGNIYVTGVTTSYQTEEGQSDITTVKYDPAGKQLWARTYTGAMQFSASGDWPNDIAVDRNGNVYVVGFSIDANDRSKFTVIKYDANGTEVWVKGNYNGSAAAVEVDGAGNIIVTGAPNMTIKYAPNGNELWVRNTGGGTALQLDAAGNAYITGTQTDDNFKEHFASYKYGSNGTLVWSNVYGNGRAQDIAVDNTGSSYITGWDYNANQIVTVKYNATGTFEWAKTVDNGRGNAIGVDANNNVFVTGFGNGDYITLKYTSGGTLLWSKLYNGPNNFDDEANALAIDAQGSVYITGTSEVNGVNGPDFSTDYATVKYDKDGNQVWVQRYNGYGNGIDEAADIALDNWNNVIVTGGSQDKNGNWDFTTIKYVQSVDASITQAHQNVSEESSAANIFKATNTPNPFITSTNIQYIIPYDGNVQINVYDVLGREVKSLVNAQQKAGSYNAAFNATQKGVYYYRITLTSQNKTYQHTGKMLKE